MRPTSSPFFAVVLARPGWAAACRAGLAVLLLSGMAPAGAAAPTVSLAGILGSKALLVIDGHTHAMAPGESVGGLRMLSVGPDQATVEIDGQRATLVLGAAPSTVGKPSSGGKAGGGSQRIVIQSDSNGHFLPEGSINGQPVQFLVDTGATTVAIGQSQAERMGLDYKSGRRVGASTANGVVGAWLVKLDAVRVGDVEVDDVDAMIVPQPMPFVLLGNSFLNQFQMTRTNEQMVLEKRF